MASERIGIKGTSDGLIITLGAGAWPGLIEELDQRLGEKASFFKGGRVGLVVGPRQLTRPQLEAVGQILSRHQISLWAVESESVGTREAAAQLGLEIGLGGPIKPAAAPAAATAPVSPGEALLVQRTLRSGQVIYHPGHVVVIGDVNPGAEIRAGGSVVVWGRLRGKVHAGAGDGQGESAVVCALHLTPTQLRIGEYITLSPGDETHHDLLPEMASVQQGQIVAEPWPYKGE
jgi:septum site-determining protein MinC